MLTSRDFKQIEKQANKIYTNLEFEIIQEIAERIANVGYINTVAFNDIKIAQESGMLYQDIISMVAKYNNASVSQIRNIFETAGAKSIKSDDKIYKEAGLNPKGLSSSMLQQLEATANKTHNNLSNLCMTTANTSQVQFYNAINKAYLETSTGVKSYSQSILDAVKDISDQGAYIEYPSGQHRSIEAATRMNILTAVNQTSGRLQLMRAEEMDWDLMELSAHSGARPEHAEWQGKIVSRSGKQGYLSLDDIGYGTATGFQGVNCRHTWFPYYEGSTLTYTDDELEDLKNETVIYNGKQINKYDATQIQRRLERNIRQNKKDIAIYQGILTSNNKDAKLMEDTKIKLANTQMKLKQNRSILNNFVEQTDLEKDSNRLIIAKLFNAKLGNNNKNGIGGTGKGQFIEQIKANQIKNKLKEYEEEIRNKKIEYAVLIDKNLNVYAYTGDKTNLKISDRDLKDAILTHNHPEITSFGEDDFSLLKANQDIKELRAVDSRYDYSIKLLKDLNITYNEAYKEGLQLAIETGEELQHCVMKKISEKGYIKYDRTRKK